MRKVVENLKVSVNTLPREVKIHYYDVRDIRKPIPQKEKYFFDLKETVATNGIVQELVKHPYPITQESVNSYVDSVNYKQDLNSNLVENRVNLGDVSAIQSLSSTDKETLRAQLSSLLAKLEESKKAKLEEENKKTEEVANE